MGLLDLIFGARRSPLADGQAEDRVVIENPPADAAWRNVRPRPDSAPVRAWRAEADRDIPTEHGVLHARGGQDMIIAYGKDNHAVVRGDIFDRTYEPLGGGLYRKRDDIVLRYFTLDRAATIKTIEGRQEAAPGDWIMQGVMGELWPVTPEAAVEKYIPA